MPDRSEEYIERSIEYNHAKFKALYAYIDENLSGGKRYDLTRRELAARFGCSTTTICRMIEGTMPLTIDDAMRLCNVFGISIRRYLGEVILGEELTPLEQRIMSLSDENILKVLEYIDFLTRNDDKDGEAVREAPKPMKKVARQIIASRESKK